MRLFENIIKVLSSSIITFISNFFIGFVLPIYLSVEEYGFYREFILYFNFYYILNLGFNEGLYIKYGGKQLSQVDHSQLIKEHNFTVLFQLIITTVIIGMAILIDQPILILFALASLFANISNFHMLIDQAFAEFTYFSKANAVKGITNVTTMIITLLVFRSSTHIPFIIALVIAQLLLFIYTEKNFLKRIKSKEKFFRAIPRFNGYMYTFKIGFFIMVANFLRVLIGSVGQWLVNLTGSIEKFAYYSLASSILSVVLLVVNAVASVFYSLIAKSEDFSVMNFIKKIILLAGVSSGLAYFVVYYFIMWLLPHYELSIPFIRYLILSVPYLMVVNILITNLYKTKKSERFYFIHMLVFLSLSVIVIQLLIVSTGDIVGAAIGTAIIYILWYFSVTSITFKFLKNDKWDMLLLLSHIVMYLVSTNLVQTFLGLLIYAIYSCVLIALFFFKYKAFIIGTIASRKRGVKK